MSKSKKQVRSPARSMWEVVYDDHPDPIPELAALRGQAPPKAPPPKEPHLDQAPREGIARRFSVPVTQEGLSLRVGR